ncbi:MAG: Xaa-Pro peptidase family protein [Chloroflexota bacterium]
MSTPLLLVGDTECNQNLFYKTHFLAGAPFIYLETQSRRMLVVSSMEAGRARKESSVSDVRTFDDFGYRELIRSSPNRDAAFAAVIGLIAREAEPPIAVEAIFPVMYADALRTEGIELFIDPTLLRSERRQKTEEEIQSIELSQRATERAVSKVIDILRASDPMGDILHFDGIPLTSERLRTEIELSLTKDSMDPGSVIVAGGPGAADPHWLGTGPLKAGESIVIDVFPRGKFTRYFADMTRTIVRGEPTSLLKTMYDTVLRAQDAALACIRAGANGKDVHRAADRLFEEAGFHGDGSGPRYIHSTGHGLGLEIHESPGLGEADVQLQPGDVITVEPGLYDPHVGAVRIEDLVVVTDDGYRNLTTFPKEFKL